jgi:hypothetical protein
MQNSQKTEAARRAELRELVDFEVADIVATGSEQGYSAKEVLAALEASVAASFEALEEDPEPANDPLADPEKTPGPGALEGPTSDEANPGVG